MLFRSSLRAVLSETLHTALKLLSVQENRSLHGEIVYLLKQTIGPDKSTPLKKESDYAE